MLWVKNGHNFLDHCQDKYGNSLLLPDTSVCKKIVRKTSGLQKYDVLSDLLYAIISYFTVFLEGGQKNFVDYFPFSTFFFFMFHIFLFYACKK
jgi:hypothetical protein